MMLKSIIATVLAMTLATPVAAQFQSLESNSLSQDEIRRSQRIRDNTRAPNSLIGGMAGEMARGAAECARDPRCSSDAQGTVSTGAAPQSQNRTSGGQVSARRTCGQFGCGGVRRIQDNGRINGDQSWAITCESGSRTVVRRNGNRWANNTGMTYSDRLWRLNLQDFAQAQCS